MLNSLASAAPATVRVGERDLLLSPLSDRDFDELSLWYQGRVIRMARASLDESSTPDEEHRVMQAAFAHAASIDFLTEFASGSQVAQKLAMPQFLWRLFRKAQPKFTLQDAEALIAAKTPLGDIIDAWHLVQFGKPDKPEGPSKNEESTSPEPSKKS